MRFWWGVGLFWAIGGLAPAIAASPCPDLRQRSTSHIVVAGDTWDRLAQTYGRRRETLRQLNPGLGDRPTLGQKLFIPPLDGDWVKVQGGDWIALGQRYGIPGEILFELNGCWAQPPLWLFIPQAIAIMQANPQFTGFSRSPLDPMPSAALGYGDQGGRFHSGIDLPAPLGTPVHSVAAGRVIWVGKQNPEGLLVIVEHDQGRQSRYGHLQSAMVQTDQRVEAGQMLGRVGQSGQPDLAVPHLHFEVREPTYRGWVAQDPLLYLPGDYP